MRAIWKKLLLSIASLVLFLGVVIGIPVLAQERFERHHGPVFEATRLGSSRAELEARAGAPSYTTDGTRWVEPQGERRRPAEGCVLEYWYHSWVLLFPSRYSYCFDADDRLVDKVHWFSW